MGNKPLGSQALVSSVSSPEPLVAPALEPIASLKQIALLADRELLERIGRLVERERRATALLVAHLAEMDRRRLHLGLGYASLFTYCTQALHLSEHAAYKRIEAARAARRFPVLFAMLTEGALHLSAVVLLAPVLTRENQAALIAEARHKTKRQVEEIVARIRPAGPVPVVVRKLPAPSPKAVPACAAAVPAVPAAPTDPASIPAPARPSASSSAPPPGFTCGMPSATVPPPPAPARPIVAPLAPDRFKVQFTASAQMHARLTRAQVLLRHTVPDGDIAQILDLALIALLEKTEARKFGRLKRGPRGSGPHRSGERRAGRRHGSSPKVARAADGGEETRSDAPNEAGRTEEKKSEARNGGKQEPARPSTGPRASTRSRYIPAEVRRAVWERDQGRCTFTSAEGVRCTETGFLEFDHREPFACGGSATTDNLRLACRRHNQHLARLRFGSDGGRVREESPAYAGFSTMLARGWGNPAQLAPGRVHGARGPTARRVDVIQWTGRDRSGIATVEFKRHRHHEAMTMGNERVRGETGDPWSRRAFLKASGLAAASMALGPMGIHPIQAAVTRNEERIMSIRPIRRVMQSQPTIEGAGVHLRRAFGFQETNEFDPFLLFDDFRNEDPKDYRAGFPWHPHRGIETITYVLAGNVAHSDSLGNSGSLGSGDVQWMTAGSGILHQEMPQGDPRGRMHGFQLWADLPASLKMTRPRYQDIPSPEIPEITDDDGTRVRVICGSFWGRTGPVDGVAAEPRYLDVSIPAGRRKTLPVETTRNAFAYIFEGSGTFRDASEPRAVRTENTGVPSDPAAEELGNRSLVQFDRGDTVFVQAGPEGIRFLLVSGKAIQEPVAWRGPIVMNTQAELRQAYAELQDGTFIKHP